MVIRQKQMETHAECCEEGFVQRAALHLRKYYPEETAPMAEAVLAQEIRYGIRRAGVYGFDSQRDVTKYLNLMFEFGRDFDVDPSCAWSQEILADSAPGKMERLYEAALATHNGAVNGGR